MPGARVVMVILLLGLAGSAGAQQTPGASSEFERGRAAMDAHDPAAAIAHFEHADTRQGRAWLAAALMMESRSPSDQYVERAYAAAARARAERPEAVRPREDVARALRAGEMVITFLVGETHAYAWAYDRDAFVGYPLPPPAELVTAVDRVNAYVEQHDPSGVQRIADDLVPALLGPVSNRLPALTRVVLVLDGPLRRLPVAQIPFSDGHRLTIATADDLSLMDEVRRAQPPTTAASSPTSRNTLLIAGVVAAGALVAGAAWRRRRSRSVA